MIGENMTMNTGTAKMTDEHHAYEEKSMQHEKEHHVEPHHTEHKEAKHRMMSLGEITDDLHEDFCDEIEDANKYMDMANSAASMCHYDLADTLCAMAKDEFSHAKFIHCFLKSSGVEIPDEVCKKWEELEQRFRRIFFQEEYY